jgi:rhomboid family GlyGly-CTERM serine protease
VFATFTPELRELLAYERTAALCGAYWQVFSSHFTHWSLDHFFWDALVVVCCGCLIELNTFASSKRQGSQLLAVTVLASAGAIGLVLLFGEVSLSTYRGLSGISVALYTLVALDIAALQKPASGFNYGYFAVAVLLGKLAFEALTGTALFVNQESAGFTTVYSAHLTGALVAIVAHEVLSKPTRLQHTSKRLLLKPKLKVVH